MEKVDEEELNVLEIFESVHETYEEVVQKASEEVGFTKVPFFNMSKTGDYTVRIGPNAPVKKDGKWVPADRKSYEYPIKSKFLKISSVGKDGKAKDFNVKVPNAKYANISVDLIDSFVSVASSKYANDQAVIKKIEGSGYDGGLKWDSQRVMYVLDMDNLKDGWELLELSYSQYKELEERKIKLWEKNLKKDRNISPCPISSIQANCVLITKKTENKKTKYLFDIDRDITEITQDQLSSLLKMPRIPDVIYRYTRFHLEATITFLKQFEEKLNIDVMSSPEIKEVIEKISLELPADDKSHFSTDKKDTEGGGDASDAMTIDDLWDSYDDLVKNEISDKSEEGLKFREDIMDFIEDNKLTTRTRGKSNKELLLAIDDELAEINGDDGDKPSDKDVIPAKEPPVKKEVPKEEPKVEDPPKVEDKKDEGEDTERQSVRDRRARREAPVQEKVADEESDDAPAATASETHEVPSERRRARRPR